MGEYVSNLAKFGGVSPIMTQKQKKIKETMMNDA